MEYSKGEWFWDKDETAYTDPHMKDCYLGTIRSDDTGLTLFTIISDFGKEEAEANAHLIVASPRMAKLLEKLIYQNGWMFEEDIEEAREIYKALAKAEGK